MPTGPRRSPRPGSEASDLERRAITRPARSRAAPPQRPCPQLQIPWALVPKGIAQPQWSNPDRREPFVEGQLAGSLLERAGSEWVAALFEHGAGRGEDPGEPPSTA